VHVHLTWKLCAIKLPVGYKHSITFVYIFLFVVCHIRYIRMARTPGSGNDCGVTTDPVLAVVHPKHARAGSAAAELLGQLAQPQQQQPEQQLLATS
jgi:hypothetical protein